jgi:hypothetical protein
MSKFSAMKKAVIAINDVLKRNGSTIGCEDYKEIVKEVASSLEKTPV